MAFEVGTGNIIDISNVSTDSEDEGTADQSNSTTRPGGADSEDADDEADSSDASERESTAATCGEFKDEPDQSDETNIAICPICLGGGRQHMLRQHMAECMANTLRDHSEAWPFTWAEIPGEAGEGEEGVASDGGDSTGEGNDR